MQDDRYFLSGSLDGKLRLWNIPDKRVALWNEIEGSSKGRQSWDSLTVLLLVFECVPVSGVSNLITAANFCQNGKYAVVGTYDGRCLFYDTEVSVYSLGLFGQSSRKIDIAGSQLTLCWALSASLSAICARLNIFCPFLFISTSVCPVG